MSDEFNEVGLGEGNIEKKEEEETLLKMINDKTSESTLTSDQRLKAKQLMQSYLSSWGIKQSNAQMSAMSPIEVNLKPGHGILRSDGYHLTPDEEDFLELKFKSLESAGIVERSKNPIWGHPVFVVDKKIK
eukprot:snap_masked-scaffold_58-processed-gene-0.43-mRNA-1 protein AED:1.00 eAED:1.00 QI:0/-1/0/0/-1/1/1/0/130